MKPTRRLFGTVLLAAAACVPALAPAVTSQYTESFKTFQYLDAANTTALWDSASGNIRLQPYKLTLEGSAGGLGDARGIVLSGDHVFVADTGTGLRVVDIRNPSVPVVVGAYATGGVPFGLDLSGDLVYIAAAGAGLSIIDITDPTAPQEIGAYVTPGTARNVTIQGSRAYVADLSSGFFVVDVSDPSAPALAGAYTTPGFCQDIAINGDYAFVATGPSGVQILDISDSAALDSVASYGALVFAQAVAVIGDLVYVANGQAGIAVLDVSDPEAPALLGSFDTYDNARDVTVAGIFAFVSDVNSGLLVIDAEDPGNLVLCSRFDTDGFAYQAVVDGPHAYVADGSGGLKVLRIGDDVDPAPAGLADTPGTSLAVCVDGTRAFVADGGSGLRVIDASLPSSPVELGSHDTPGTAQDVVISCNYAYVADGTAGVRIVDVSDPENPALAASVNTPGESKGIATAGDFVFVADGGSGLQVVDVTDPEVPVLVGNYDTDGDAKSVALAGHIAYVVDGGIGTAGLRVIDVSDRTSPERVGSVTFGNEALALALHGNYAIVLLADSALVTVDVTQAAAPVIKGFLNLAAAGGGIVIAGNTAYIPSGPAGLQLVDVTDPENLARVASWDVADDARGIDVWGQYAYLADGTSGLRTTQILNYSVDTADNVVQSLAINTPGDELVSVRVKPTATDSIRWEITADGGAHWDEVPADSAWYTLSNPGSDLRWRTTHTVARPGTNPTCSFLEIAWLGAAATIDSIRDVPGDDGGWVRLYLTRSGYDLPEEQSLPIVNYVIHRRVDDTGLLLLIAAKGRPEERRVGPAVDGGSAGANQLCLDVVTLDGRMFTPAPDVSVGFPPRTACVPGSNFPPGTWEIVGCVPALQQEAYIVSVPTVVDSVDTLSYSVFVVSAHTTAPTVFFVSEPDSGFSVNNSIDLTPPAVPWGFTVTHRSGIGNVLSWFGNTEPDFLYYKIYRDTIPGFIHDQNRLLYQTFDTTWTDPIMELRPHYYKLTAVDMLFNESEPAASYVATGAPSATGPSRTALFQNVPNPFNPATRIRYDLAAAAEVSLRIFDVSGRLVKTIVDGRQEAGVKTAIWNGCDESGRRVASGIYFCQLETAGFTETRKMTLVE